MTDSAILSIPVQVYIGPAEGNLPVPDNVPTDAPTQALYTYVDPASGQQVTYAPACILNAESPYETVFTLDVPSTRHGWTFYGALPSGKNGAVPRYVISENQQSLTTATDKSIQAYRFFLSFYNKPTGMSFKDDPQENNVPKVKTPDDDHP